MHFIQLQLHELFIDQERAAAAPSPRAFHGAFTRRLTYAQRVRREIEVAELARSTAAHFDPAMHCADDVGMRDSRIVEDELRILIEAPSAFVEDLADAKPWRARRH